MIDAPALERGVRSRVDPPSPPLSVLLRNSTRSVHAATEVAFALERSLSGVDAYVALLTGLRVFHVAVEAALGRIEGWDELTPSIDLRARRRAFRIDEDLAELGRPGPTTPGLPVTGSAAKPTDAMRLASMAEGLGCLYVTEGSTLGGRVIAARARTALGQRIPTAFFADPTRDIAQDWNALRAAVDAFGAGDTAAASPDVVDAAHRTFGVFTAVLERERATVVVPRAANLV